MAFTDAAAGNLALHVGDDPAQVRLRRGELEQAAGLGPRRFAYMNQVHGSNVAMITGGADGVPPGGTAAPTADAMVSRGVPLAVMVADCVPVVLVGEQASGAPLLGVVHAGRPGVASGVVPAAVARLRALGAGRVECLDRPVDLRVLLRGPGRHACRRRGPRPRDLVHHVPRHAGT